MSSKYNLNETAGLDYFEFTLDDFKYKMAYPSAKEVMTLSELASKSDELTEKINSLQGKLVTASEDEKPVLQKQLDGYTKEAGISQRSFIDWCMDYITPEVKDAPDIKKSLMNKSVKYLLAFVNMVQEELKG